MKTIILRFRDLVTEAGETIRIHRAIVNSFGEVWWGWWMRQYENIPYNLFQELAESIEKAGELHGYCFNSGTTELYTVQIKQIAVAPGNGTISSPDPEKTPEYYHMARYPAWFLLRSIEDIHFSDVKFFYDLFLVRPELQEGTLAGLMGQPVASLEQLRQIDVTLWVVQAQY
ncbi:MAG: hypothetical protein KJ077_28840 [Anaerolineae bacterium]|nr:hypothetical protein [Anaerolineae bacterium]